MTSNIDMIVWAGTATALSSISHAGDTRGTLTLLRRERIICPDGTICEIPIISGNCLRGALRRRAEEQLRDVLDYTGQLSLAAAHTLRAGGSLTKTSSGEPLSGSRLATLRALIPPIGLFGAATTGRIIDGCLQVGKLVPHLTETVHITGAPATRSAFDTVQIEYYTQADPALDHAAPSLVDDTSGTQPMRYGIETFPAGTRFDLRLQLHRPSLLEAAFFTDLITSYATNATIGGRLGIGHGRLHLDITPHPTPPTMDWRAHLHHHRNDAIDALKAIQ